MVVESKSISFYYLFESIYSVFSGSSWGYLWYLYALIGLYLITPVLRVITDNADNTLIKYILIILFIFTCFIPYIKGLFNINIDIYTPFVPTTNLLYYVLGYYLSNGFEKNSDKRKK